MNARPFLFATAIALAIGTAHPAHALSVGNSEFANTDGTSKFSDPDEKFGGEDSSGAATTVLPLANGSAMTFSTTQNLAPVHPAAPCTGAGCSCANCSGK